MYRFSNNAVSTLVAGIAEDAEAITVTAGEGDLFDVLPQSSVADGSFQAVTLTHASLPGLYEVIKLTAKTTDDSFTVVRGLESPGGISQAWPAGTKVSARVTTGMLRQFVQSPTKPGGAYRLSDNSSSIVLSGNGEKGAAALGYGSFVVNAVTRVYNSWAIGGYNVLQHAQFLGANSFNPCMASETVGGTHPVDLGVPRTWTSGSYKRGSVIRPTTPDGNQYWIDIADITDDTVMTVTEPNLPTEGVRDRWVQTAMPVNISHLFMPSVRLVVSEVGFICEEVTATTKPTVSVGDESNPVRFANGMELSQIMGNGHVHRIPIATGGAPVRGLSFRVDTSPTDGTFLGRFYFKGFFVEAPQA